MQLERRAKNLRSNGPLALLLALGACSDGPTEEFGQNPFPVVADASTAGDGGVEIAWDAAQPPFDSGSSVDGDPANDDAGATNTPDAPDGSAECNADSHEPDDTLQETEEHDPINGIQPVVLNDLAACPGDVDWVWAGRVDNGGIAGAVLTWDASLGQLALSLGDADAMPITQLDVSSTASGRAELQVNEYYGQYFYVRVTNSGALSIPYDLKVTAQEFGP